MELKPVIMVVDDDIQLGQIVTGFLEKHNHDVNYFASPKKALTCLSILKDASHGGYPPSGPTPPDCFRIGTGVNLLITDMAMPEMTGMELIRQAKKLFPALPVIVMSGSLDGQDSDEIVALGADFIPKPFDLANLLERVKSHLPAGRHG